ncbi:MAG: hypothetical protein DRN05_05120 [Thermoplasmata archaeon]|nr:MAG: hypothetical protein DRN05_05120 [Thermoplasmata archaeon]
MDKEKELPISRILLTSLLTPPEERAEYILSLPIQTRRYVLKQLKEVEKGNILPVAWSILAEPEVSSRYKRELRRLLEQRLPREVVEQYQKLYAQPPRALIVTPAEALRYGALQALSFGFYQPPEAILAEIQRQKHTPAYSIGNIAGNLISFGLLATPVGWATKALGISKLVAQIPTQARRAYVVARLAQHMAQSGTVFGIHEALNQMGRNLHEKGYITIDDWNSILRNVAEGMAFGLTGAPTFAKVPKYVKL